MNEQMKKVLKKILLTTVTSFFILAAVLSMFAPFIVPQINKPENIANFLLLRAKIWQTIHANTGTEWESSDSTTAEYVTDKPTDTGVLITLGATQVNTREAYFTKKLIAKHAFKLSVEVNTPKDCHNGLVFRGNAQGEYYLFLVKEPSYTVEILRREANNDLPREAIIPNTDVPEFIGKPRTLMVLGDGERYFFYINDILVNNMSDSRLNGNRIGIEVFT